MHKDLAYIDSLKAKLASLRPLNQGELRRVRDDFNIKYTYDSNAIEGSTLTLRETALILKEDVTIAGKPLRMHLDAIGHRDAFEYVLSIAKPDDPLTERRIKELHALVLMNDTENRGTYRKLPVMIRGASNQPPQPYLVTPQMEALLAWYADISGKKHPLEIIAEFHLRFEGIHPFIDGNGRVGRLVMNLELIKAGYLPVNIPFEDRQEYYACFDAYFGQEKTSDAFTALVARHERLELERYISIVQHG